MAPAPRPGRLVESTGLLFVVWLECQGGGVSSGVPKDHPILW